MNAPLDQALAELEQMLGPPDGPPEPLGGGLTNENLILRFASGPVVLRRAGAGTDKLGIDRTAEVQATRNAARLGIGPPVVATLSCDGSLVTRYLDAWPLDAAAIRGARFGAAVDLLRKVHDGPPLSITFDVGEIVAVYESTARERGVAVHPHEALAREIVAKTQAVLTGDEHLPVACHNDLLAANLLDDGARLWLIDWEYAGVGDRYFDLANLAVNNDFDDADEVRLLERYFGKADDRRLARLRLMRLVSDVREAYWGLVQQGVSTLDVDYASYADSHFTRLAEAASYGRLEDLLSAAR